MKKKILALLIVAALALTAIGCDSAAPETKAQAAPAATEAPAAEASAAPAETPAEAPEAQAAVANPVNSVAGYNELLAAQPNNKINNAPTGAESVMYSWISNIPAISQIEFSYKGCTYTYRAAFCPNDSTSVDISGVYTQLPSVSTVEINEANTAGGSYVLRYDAKSGEGVANWTSPLVNTAYSLYTPNGCKDEMPLKEVMAALFNCSVGAKSGKGTVLSVTGATVAVSLENGETVVLDATPVKTITVAANDTVEFLYFGDLAADADLIRIVKTGVVEKSTFKGTINFADETSFVAYTSDGNVFAFIFDENTKITGQASVLAEGEVVTVTYTGNLYDTAKALEVNIDDIKPVPTEAPKAQYTERTASGYVTSIAGKYITVSGDYGSTYLYVDSSKCYVSGNAYIGVYADINYRDYGTGSKGYVVTAAYFYSATPTPDPYTTRNTAGTVTDYEQNGHDYTVYVNGMVFSFNTRGIGGEGTPAIGAWANIYYRDYGYGYYEVTEAYFSGGDTPQDIDYRVTDGYVQEYNGTTVCINGGYMMIAFDCTTTGYYSPGCYATVYYRHNPNMSHDQDEVYYIEFSGGYNPQPEYSDCYVEGYITSAYGSVVCVNGVAFDWSGASTSGYPQTGGYAQIYYRDYGSYTVVENAYFEQPLVYEEDTNYLDADFPEEWMSYNNGWEYNEWDTGF